MTSRNSGATSVLAWVMAGLVVVTTVVLVVAGLDHLGATTAEVIEGLLFVSVGPVYSVIAAVIIDRDSRNVVGWMMMLIALGISYGVVFEVTVPSTAPTGAGALYLLYLGLGGASWLFFIIPTFHLLLTFPSGRFLSPRWRWLAVVEIALVLYLVFFTFFARELGPVDLERADWTVINPIGFLEESDFNVGIFAAALVILALGALTSVVVRFVRSRGIERQQLKVLIFASCLYAAMYAWTGLQPGGENSVIFSAILWLGVAGIGVGVAVAMLRYRLYDIDRVISRTVSYSLVVGLLLAIVAIVALAAGTRFRDPWIVAATTLAVAALFNPLRTRVRKLVDHRFNRSPYDAERVIDGFASSLRGRVDADAVVDGWLGVVEETMQPESVGVWVRP